MAAECAEDLAADGVVYAEVRFAPELHLEAGLSLDQVVDAVVAGMAEGAAGRNITVGILLTAMRHAARSVEIAELALRHRDEGVVGFDIAGSEAGYPPTRHLDAFRLIAQGNFHITIHAGEAFGLPSIWEAVQHCGAERLGHGVRIVDDIVVGPTGEAELGRLASFIRDRRVALELCPTSNVDTGAAPSIAEHPIDLLKRLRFRVTVNTDNRLMSDITLSRELAGLVDTFGYGWDDVEWMTINAMKSAFWPFEGRLQIINGIIKPGFAALKWAGTTTPVAASGARVTTVDPPRRRTGRRRRGHRRHRQRSIAAAVPRRPSRRGRGRRRGPGGHAGDPLHQEGRQAGGHRPGHRAWSTSPPSRAPTPRARSRPCAPRPAGPTRRDPTAPPVAAVCVYPDMVPVAVAALGGQRRQGGLGRHRLSERPGVAGGQAGRRRRRRGGRAPTRSTWSSTGARSSPAISGRYWTRSGRPRRRAARPISR